MAYSKFNVTLGLFTKQIKTSSKLRCIVSFYISFVIGIVHILYLLKHCITNCKPEEEVSVFSFPDENKEGNFKIDG